MFAFLTAAQCVVVLNTQRPCFCISNIENMYMSGPGSEPTSDKNRQMSVWRRSANVDRVSIMGRNPCRPLVFSFYIR
jgi:hypothetical protein